MGTYTLLRIDSYIHNLTDTDFNTLEYMMNGGDRPKLLPAHPLFNSRSSWETMLRTDSAYFDEETESFIECNELHIQCNFKNYNDEIFLFHEYISRFLDCNTFEVIGFYRCEFDRFNTYITKFPHWKKRYNK